MRLSLKEVRGKGEQTVSASIVAQIAGRVGHGELGYAVTAGADRGSAWGEGTLIAPWDGIEEAWDLLDHNVLDRQRVLEPTAITARQGEVLVFRVFLRGVAEGTVNGQPLSDYAVINEMGDVRATGVCVMNTAGQQKIVFLAGEGRLEVDVKVLAEVPSTDTVTVNSSPVGKTHYKPGDVVNITVTSADSVAFDSVELGWVWHDNGGASRETGIAPVVVAVPLDSTATFDVVVPEPTEFNGWSSGLGLFADVRLNAMGGGRDYEPVMTDIVQVREHLNRAESYPADQYAAKLNDNITLTGRVRLTAAATLTAVSPLELVSESYTQVPGQTSYDYTVVLKYAAPGGVSPGSGYAVLAFEAESLQSEDTRVVGKHLALASPSNNLTAIRNYVEEPIPFGASSGPGDMIGLHGVAIHPDQDIDNLPFEYSHSEQIADPYEREVEAGWVSEEDTHVHYWYLLDNTAEEGVLNWAQPAGTSTATISVRTCVDAAYVTNTNVTQQGFTPCAAAAGWPFPAPYQRTTPVIKQHAAALMGVLDGTLNIERAYWYFSDAAGVQKHNLADITHITVSPLFENVSGSLHLRYDDPHCIVG